MYELRPTQCAKWQPKKHCALGQVKGSLRGGIALSVIGVKGITDRRSKSDPQAK